MNNENRETIIRFLETLILEHFDVIASDDTLESIADKLNDTWDTISSEGMLHLLHDAGIEEADEESADVFNEELYNKLLCEDLED